jgi:hypothetical protein
MLHAEMWLTQSGEFCSNDSSTHGHGLWVCVARIALYQDFSELLLMNCCYVIRFANPFVAMQDCIYVCVMMQRYVHQYSYKS